MNRRKFLRKIGSVPLVGGLVGWIAKPAVAVPIQQKRPPWIWWDWGGIRVMGPRSVKELNQNRQITLFNGYDWRIVCRYKIIPDHKDLDSSIIWIVGAMPQVPCDGFFDFLHELGYYTMEETNRTPIFLYKMYQKTIGKLNRTQ